MYLIDADMAKLLSWLNSDREIAFICPNGKKSWIAKQTRESISEGRHILWHVPSGPLPLYRRSAKDILGAIFRKRLELPGLPLEEDGFIKDPWSGWKGPCEASNSNVPFLGSIPQIFTLDYLPITQTESGQIEIGLSHIGWIGGRYSSLGQLPTKEAKNWWKRLNNWVRKIATKIPRGNIKDWEPEAWAFPSALMEINAGKPCALN